MLRKGHRKSNKEGRSKFLGKVVGTDRPILTLTAKHKVTRIGKIIQF